LDSRFFKIISMIRKITIVLAVAGCFLLFFGSCVKLTIEEPPVANWENFGSDSVKLNVFIRTKDGFLLTGQYVSLALSQDSLDKLILVRKVTTDGYGRAQFPRLYPRKYYFNCYANYQGTSLIGLSSIFLPSVAKLDTSVVLTVL